MKILTNKEVEEYISYCRDMKKRVNQCMAWLYRFRIHLLSCIQKNSHMNDEKYQQLHWNEWL